MRQTNILAVPDAWMPARSQAMKDAFRTWMAARTQALKRERPSRLKRDCWRTAQKEWLELRRQQKRRLKEIARRG
jgi:hypothetical protein